MKRGFQLVTVSEMMSFRSEPMKAGWEYSRFDRSNLDAGLLNNESGEQPGNP
jgi:hypothetical protein